MPNNIMSNYVRQKDLQKEQMNPLSQLETSTTLSQKEANLAGRK